jgi:hypothetical protein
VRLPRSIELEACLRDNIHDSSIIAFVDALHQSAGWPESTTFWANLGRHGENVVGRVHPIIGLARRRIPHSCEGRTKARPIENLGYLVIELLIVGS